MPPVLLLGETGTGKGLLARLLHRGSVRREGPLVELNCAAIPETMLEAELFGYERGAFTDARQAKPGLFQAAEGGTLFLDEIGLLPVTLQGKLLKAVEDHTVRRLGSTRVEPIDVWIIAATSEDLVGKSEDGRFRQDLYHRLAVICFGMPELRRRGRDILMLADRFVAAACQDYGLPRKRLSPAAESALLAYGWPGNVRELANVVERAVLLFDGAIIPPQAFALPDEARRRPAPDAVPLATSGPGGDRRREQVLDALRTTDWNITQAARALGISRNTVKAWIRRYGLARESAAPTPPVPDPGARAAAGATVEAKPPATMLWESRRLTLLRAHVSQPEDGPRWGLDEVLGSVTEKVTTFGGRVEDVSPRAIVAVFGLEVIDDAARRAANAALAMIRMLRDRKGAPAVTCAIHAAELLVARLPGTTAIDAQSKREASAILEILGEHAAENTVLVSAAAAPLLSRRFELVPLGTTRPHAGQIYRLAGQERSGFVPFADGGSFVGRHDDLEVAQRRFALAERGHGQVFALVGEAGIGKSRLLYEFRRTIANRGCRVIETSCAPHGAAFPFAPIVDIVRKLLGLGDTDDARTVREAVSRAADKLGPALAGDNLPATLALLDALPAEDAFKVLTPLQRRQRVEEAVCQLVFAESARQPLVVVVEDVHWIDSDSQAVLEALIDRLADVPVMLVLSQRPEYRTEWSRKPFYQQVTLGPLTSASVRSVLDELLGGDERLGPLKDAIVARTDGNPFFVEETVRTLVESGALVGQPGAYTPAERVDTLQVPPTVEAVLTERIDRLGVADKLLLQAAVVVGSGGSVEILAKVAELPAESFRASLDRLHRARFLHEEGGADDAVIAFRHSLVQEVAYASLPPAHRRELHGRCLTALEGAPDDVVEQAAHHAFHGESWDKASRYARRAAGKAIARSAYRSGVSALNQALVALDKLPPTRETLALAIDARFDLRNMLWALGELSHGIDVLQDAVPLAEALGDQRRLARVFANMSSNYWVLGDNDRALAAGQQAVTLANRLDDLAVRIDCNQLLGLLHHSLGDYHEAARFLERVIGELRADRPGRFSAYYAVHSRTWLAWTMVELGQFDRAASLAEEAVAAAELSGEVHNVVAATWGRGLVELSRGAVHAAIPLLRRAHEAAQSAEMTLWARPTAALLGRALVLAGDVAGGRRLLELAVSGGENNVAVVEWQTYRAEACLAAGELELAQTVIDRALELADKRGERGFRGHALRVAAELARRREDIGRARESYEDAMAVAHAQGMAPLLAQCELGLAQLCRGADDSEAAERHAASARALYSELGIPVPEIHEAVRHPRG